MPYPTTSHTSGTNAVADLVSASVAAGYTPNASLGVLETVASITRQLLTTSPALKVYTPTLSPVAVGTATCAAQSLTVTGITTAEKVIAVIKPTNQAGLGISCSTLITGANTISVNFVNPTAGSITPTASEVYTIITVTP